MADRRHAVLTENMAETVLSIRFRNRCAAVNVMDLQDDRFVLFLYAANVLHLVLGGAVANDEEVCRCDYWRHSDTCRLLHQPTRAWSRLERLRMDHGPFPSPLCVFVRRRFSLFG